MPLKIHITSVKNEFDLNDELHVADTIRFTNEQMDKFIKY